MAPLLFLSIPFFFNKVDISSLPFIPLFIVLEYNELIADRRSRQFVFKSD